MDEEVIKQKAKILVVDDDEATVQLLQRLLEHEGYAHIHIAMDPRQVPTLYRKVKPDLIILDLHMPYWNGFVVLEELSAALAEERYLPVLMITGDPSPDVKNQALVLGVKDFLHKPPDLFEARYRIRNLLQTRFLYLELQERLRERESTSSAPTAEGRGRQEMDG